MRPLPLNRAWRFLGVLFVALALVMFAGAGHRAVAADGQVPWVPTDAQIQAQIAHAVAACESGGVYDRCSQVGAVTKWHEIDIPDYDRMNVVMIIMEQSFLEGDGKTRFIVYGARCSVADFATKQLLEFDGCGGGGATPDQAMARSDPVSAPTVYQTGWDLRPLPAAATPTPTPSPSGPLGPCVAAIQTTSSLKAGDTLSPYANVTSADGTPVQGEITEVWYFNGVQANSVTWDGNPVQVILQLSCQGHAQDFTATFNGTMGATSDRGASATSEPTGTPEPSPTPEPTATPEPSAAPSASALPSGQSQPHGVTPGLQGVGHLPGPADGTQGVIGMLAPGILGILGGLLASGFGGGAGGTGGTGGTGAPVGPDGKAPSGGGTPDKDSGPDGSGPAGGAAATQAAIDNLTTLMNSAFAAKNTAMKDAINAAQANAFDATGKVDPEKYAAALKAIGDAAGIGAAPLGAATFYDPSSTTDMAMKAMSDTWLGKHIDDAAKSIVGLGSRVEHSLAQLWDAASHPIYFGMGVDKACRNVAPADSQAMDTALADGNYLDALWAGAMTYGKGYLAAKQAVDKVAGDMAWNMGKSMLPVEEVKTLFDPKASLADKYWAAQVAGGKVALLFVPFLGEARAAGAALGAARAAEGAAAGAEAASGARAAIGAARAAEGVEAASGARAASSATGAAKAAEAAETASGARAASSATGAAKAAETGAAAEASSGARTAGGAAAQGAEGAQAVATSVKNIEQKVAAALGDKPAPTNFAGGKRFLDENPEVRDAIDKAIQEHGDTDAIRMARQNGEMGAAEHNLYTARRLDLQNQAMDRASQRIAQLEAERCQAAGEAVPRRVITSQASEGDRVLSGAHARSDLDRTHYASHVAHEEAENIVKEECENLGFSQKSLGTNAYVAKPGTLMDTAAADTNQGAWLGNNLAGVKGKSGQVWTHVSSDGTITAGEHIGGGAGSDALPLGGRSERPYLTADEMSSSAADQIPKLDKAVAANNVSDGVKYTARAVKCGTAFSGPKDALYRAAMTKDPALQVQILKEAGIGSVAELRGMLGL